MTETAAKEPPCTLHRNVFITTCSFFVMASTILINNVIANDRLRSEADSRISTTVSQNRDEQTQLFREMTREMNDNMTEIKQRLARIEAKM